MKKSAAAFKTPDLEKDRKQLVKEIKRDLDEMLNDPAMLDKITDLVRVLKAAKKARKRK